jgi:hypothetical protein
MKPFMRSWWFKVGHRFTASAWDSFTHQSAQYRGLVLDYIANHMANEGTEIITLEKMDEIFNGVRMQTTLPDGRLLVVWMRYDNTIVQSEVSCPLEVSE